MEARALKRPIFADLVGGISITGLMLPEGIAYSAIAGLPASFGVSAAVIGPLGYAIIGRSRLAVVTATSGAAALLAAGIANAAIPGVPRVDCALALTLLVGIFFLFGAALRLSALTSFVSRAVLQGFGLGLAITITIRQLPILLGIAATQSAPLQILGSILLQFRKVHMPSALLGCAALVFLSISRRLGFVAAGLILTLGSVVAMHFGPAGHFGIATAGPLGLELSAPHVPAMAVRDWGRLAQLAFPIALVLLAESWATIRSLAATRGDPISPEREIAALGLANIASALWHGLPVGAGFSIGNANAQAGTASRLGAGLAALAVAIAAITAANWIALIPEPVLAAIVISALAHALSPRPIYSLFRLNRDQWIALAAAVGVLLLGLVNGLLLAVALSVLGLLRRLAYPDLSVLGRTGDHDFVDCAAHPDARQIPGLLVIRPNAPLFFGNAETVLAEIGRRALDGQASTIVLSLEETNDLDSSALEAICDFRQAMTAQNRVLILARVHDRVRAILERGGLSDLAEKSTFSVDDAVRMAPPPPSTDGGDAGVTADRANPSH
ncbi:MAG TPA: SulP family inorganic anion transporter [Sphingomicrobium sp.]|jgi:MFS superfamily sulfate permease-like transporter|nr:SulP family inorganic anion transporter [Sphingomicrobium sp.]